MSDIFEWFLVRRTISDYVYRKERELFDAQHIGEGYTHQFVYLLQVSVDQKCQERIIAGLAWCNCSFGFGIEIDWKEG